MRANGLVVAHVITGLDVGGAETALWRLVTNLDSQRFTSEVFSLTCSGEIGDRITAAGVAVEEMGMRPSPAALLAVARLRSRLRQRRPDVVQTWLYHADVIGGLAARAAGVDAVAWGLRGSDLEGEAFSRRTTMLVRSAARLSKGVPDVIVCGSEAAGRFHLSLGYDERKLVVIPNGFEVPRLEPDTRARVRAELGLSDDDVVVGRVARFHPHKGYRTFVEAAGIVARERPEATFLMCGTGVDEENAELARWVDDAGIRARMRLLGRRTDVAAIHMACDVACSSSIGEGFPNVVGEAMALAVPAVVTDVGDSALLVGDTGRVVPPRNPTALARALVDLIDLGVEGRRTLGDAARARINSRFSLGAMAASYEALYERMAADVRHKRRPR